ncbi:MAG: hypothetical protein GY757_62035 [bacterium]|nr:hypothetical protein [bacterium]
MDSLALLFIIYAEDNGVKIPSRLKSGIANALVESYRKEEDLGTSAAYTAYILNKAGKDVSFMVDPLLTKEDALGLTGYSYLVITLMEMGRDRDAKKIWQKVKNFVRLGTRTVDINETYERRWYFDSEIRQIATLSWAGLMMDEDSEILQRYLNTLEQRFNGATWRSRTDYLWSVIAMKAFVDEDSIDSINLKTKVLLNNQEVGNKAMKSFDDSTLDLNFPIFDAPLADLPKGQLYPLRIEKEGTGNIYYAAQIEYALPSEISLPRDEGISVFLQYETLEGEQVEPDQIETGTTYRIKVVISSNRRRSYLSLDVPVPSGIEIIDPSFATTSSYKPEGGVNDETWTRETSYGDEYEFSGEGYGYYDHYFGDFWWYWKNEPDQEIYDNHLTYSWETFYEGKRELTFLVRATSAGIYPTPPAQATLLFEPEVFGRTGGSLFVIQ